VLAVLLEDLRPGLLELLWKAVLEDPRVLDQVIVHGHDLVVILQRHDGLLL
jgi:hypothetical protein